MAGSSPGQRRRWEKEGEGQKEGVMEGGPSHREIERGESGREKEYKL